MQKTDVLYISGEESLQQIKIRAERIGEFGDTLSLLCEMCIRDRGKVETFGFSSLGGMAGILLGVWIFTKISKEHKIELWTAYVLALGLMYAVSKLGCFFAGCCVGMRYQGPGSIRYLDNGAAGEYLFPDVYKRQV